MDKYLTSPEAYCYFLGRMKNIAVIGAGISGLAAAYLLSRRHRVQLFEKEARLGGHTNTVLFATPNGSVRSIPASWCTTTAPIRTWCGCSGSFAQEWVATAGVRIPPVLP